jgi:hypothetical protein
VELSTQTNLGEKITLPMSDEIPNLDDAPAPDAGKSRNDPAPDTSVANAANQLRLDIDQKEHELAEERKKRGGGKWADYKEFIFGIGVLGCLLEIVAMATNDWVTVKANSTHWGLSAVTLVSAKPCLCSCSTVVLLVADEKQRRCAAV